MKKISFLMALTLLAGCGQAGPLYLPTNPKPPVKVPHVHKQQPEQVETMQPGFNSGDTFPSRT